MTEQYAEVEVQFFTSTCGTCTMVCPEGPPSGYPSCYIPDDRQKDEPMCMENCPADCGDCPLQ